MTLSDLVSLAQARLVFLGQLRTAAARIGDVVRVAECDTEIAQTTDTLAQLQSLTP